VAFVLHACSADNPRDAADPFALDAGGDSGSVAASPEDGPVLDAAAPSQSTSQSDAATAMGCVKGTYMAQARPLDMFILLDQSGSMQEDEDRWTPVTKAIKTFVGSPEAGNIGVALQYFPLGSDDTFKCQSKNYETPDVPLASLPANAQAIVRSIDAHYFSHDECCDTPEHSGTPTRPALEGAVAYMQSYMQKNPDRVGVILLATDGEPSSVCDDNKASHVAEVVKRAAQGAPAIRTYVIGIGDDEYLDEMAAEGGTGRGPFIVDGSGKRTESELLLALAEIRNEALPCDYPISDIKDSTRLNVETLQNDGSAQTLVNVASASGCDKAEKKGWFYDDPKAPKRIQLCPDTCTQLSAAKTSSVRIVEGCETVVLF
jgi:hypothetical protein